MQFMISWTFFHVVYSTVANMFMPLNSRIRSCLPIHAMLAWILYCRIFIPILLQKLQKSGICGVLCIILLLLLLFIII